ncbi:hypothetical protein CRM22_010801 [Opisthorchis felineus]|uniref:MD-2-related lipid-recognition domain-containing protein n=1 Tax=Opisthorchis felineus TaxID=147828 RepID=A0A4S2KM91_OPIFE|nr:hypothetical protein CRM22_010801 [Opisthorchis felineus]
MRLCHLLWLSSSSSSFLPFFAAQTTRTGTVLNVTLNHCKRLPCPILPGQPINYTVHFRLQLPAENFYHIVGWAKQDDTSILFHEGHNRGSMPQLSYQTVNFYGIPRISRPQNAKLMMTGYAQGSMVFCVMTDVTSSRTAIGNRCVESL